MSRLHRNECRIADCLFDGELTVSELSRRSKLQSVWVREVLERLMANGEVEIRFVPDRSGEPGRTETRYSLVRTQRKRA